MNDALRDFLPEILIVDDDKSVVMALHAVLNKLGRIRFAINASQAFSMINELPPDLILLDVELPDESGLEVCKELKKDPHTSGIPILFITSKTETGFEERVFDAGASDYILKPLKPRVVAARVQTHLAYHHALVQLNQLAYTDSLSGLPNRLTLDEQLAIEFRRARRQMEPLSVVMIDIDEFKKFNDHFGHVAGDDCIRTIGMALKNIAKRPADLAARYGGEEFALILPNTAREGAESIIVNLLKVVAELGIKHAPDAQFPIITVSVGYSTLEPASCDFCSLEPFELVNTADRALYQSKHDGRNRFTYEPFAN